MSHRIPTLTQAAARLLLVALACACQGNDSPDDARADAAGSDHDAGGDGADDAASGDHTVTGVVRDEFTSVTLAGAEVDAVGLDPAPGTTSDDDGGYQLDLPATGVLRLRGGLAATHRPTFNPAIDLSTVPAGPFSVDIRVVSTADAARQHTVVDQPVEAGTAILFADLVDVEGSPAEGIPLPNIALVDGDGQPVGVGPYFVGAAGDVDPAVEASAAHDGRARVVFLNVPPGTQRLDVEFDAGSAGEADIVAVAGGAILERVAPAR